MTDDAQLYTSGSWTVKPGKETEFIHAWQEFAAWTSQHQAGAGWARLIQDVENPQRFFSFGD